MKNQNTTNPYNAAADVAGGTQASQTSNQPSNQSKGGERIPWNRFALFVFPMVIGAVADLWSKSAVFQRFYPLDPPFYQAPYWIFEPIFGIQTSTNAGALFGLGQGYSGLFAVLSVVVMIGVLVWLFALKAAMDRWLTFTLGLVSGGIIGNFYDRVGWGYDSARPIEIKYHVRDWILFRLEGVPFFDPWPNFNIADSLLVTGAILLMVHAFCFASPPAEIAVAATDADSAPETGPTKDA